MPVHTDHGLIVRIGCGDRLDWTGKCVKAGKKKGLVFPRFLVKGMFPVSHMQAVWV